MNNSVVFRRVLGRYILTALMIFANPTFAADPVFIKVGIMSGEDEDVWNAAVVEAKKNGLEVKLVLFNDYTQPNEALNEGEIQANSFQTGPYLANQIKIQRYKIVPVGFTAVWPIGLYSKKFNNTSKLPDGATIGVPNDPSNEGRALSLLQSAGLITLREGAGFSATVADISLNPKNIKIKELDTGVIGRAVDDLDAAVVNTDWALKSNLTAKERIAQESVENNPYRCFIAVREADKDKPWVKLLVASYQTKSVDNALTKAWKGAAIKAY